MKIKLLTYIALAVSLASMISCSDKMLEEQSVLIHDEKDCSLKRSPEEALNIANLFVRSFSDPTRSNNEASDVDNVVVIENGRTRVSADTLLYAVNMNDNNGYVIVSAFAGDDGIIGYVENGTYNSDKINPAYKFYLDAACGYVANEFKSHTISPSKPMPDPSTVDIYKTETVGPNVTVEWGQRYPEGIYCPNGIAGCVQTAMAQIMSFIQQPSSIKLTYPDRDINIQNLTWSDILKHKKSSSSKNLHLECVANEEAHKAIGRLCRELGYRNEAIYNSTSTGSDIYAARNTLYDLLDSNIVSSIQSFDTKYQNLSSFLSDGKTVSYIRGSDGAFGGHAWVCDGYNLTTIGSNVTLSNGDIVFEIKSETIYYHFNWGWNGQDNGYFKAGVFSTNEDNGGYNFKNSVMFFTVK